jgi:hypothetical protein
MILDKIVENSRLELENRKTRVPLERIQKMALEKPRPLDLAMALQGERVG